MIPSITVGTVLILAYFSKASVISKNSLKSRNFLADTQVVSREAIDYDLIRNCPIKVHDANLIASLPENFDAREKWPYCSSLNEIRDQGACASCWVVAAVAAMSDRVCIHSNGTKKVRLSAQDLLSCENEVFTCTTGGEPSYAWHLWKHNGIVSGGSYNSSEGCKPYEIPPCEYFGKQNTCVDNYITLPKCQRKCIPGSNVEYDKDKHFGKSVYWIKGEDNIRAELFKNGPVEAMFDLYMDFFEFKTGLYWHQHGDEYGSHAVKIIGYGVEEGKKYWLVANSLGRSWGDNGFFKFLRGSNECGIEAYVVAGEPALDL